MFTDFGLNIIESVLNKAITLDPEAADYLHAISDKVIFVQVPTIKFQCYAHVSGKRIFLQESVVAEPDLTMTCHLGYLLEWLSHGSGNFISDNLKITGDVELAKALNDFLQHFHIDWEEQLSKIVGDYLAHQMVYQFKMITKRTSQAKSDFVMDVSEYLQDERNLLAPKQGALHFIDQVDVLRNDVDRLNARVARLKRQMSEG